MSEKNNHMPSAGDYENYNDRCENEQTARSVPTDRNTRIFLKNSLRQILEQRKNDTDNVMGDEYYEEVAATLLQLELEDGAQPDLNEEANE